MFQPASGDEKIKSPISSPSNNDSRSITSTYFEGYAVHKGIGEKLWRASCPVSLFGAPLSSVFVTGRDSVLVAANGKTTCLDLFTDSTKWTHKMKGCDAEEVDNMYIESCSKTAISDTTTKLNGRCIARLLP